MKFNTEQIKEIGKRAGISFKQIGETLKRLSQKEITKPKSRYHK
ncbi:protein of unknown function [Tenacibaculum sp. 190524A02b]